MTAEKITELLTERFSAPLEGARTRRIIFWFDPDGEFSAMAGEIQIPEVKVRILTPNNFFETKYTLLTRDRESNYLVYNGLNLSPQEDWLRGLERANESFRADFTSIQMRELGIDEDSPLRGAVKSYHKFFENAARTKNLLRWKTNYEKESQLDIDILATLSGARENTVAGVIRALLAGGLVEEENAALTAISKYGSMDRLMETLERFTGYEAEEISLRNFARHLIYTGADRELEIIETSARIEEDRSAACAELLKSWARSRDRETLYLLAQAFWDEGANKLKEKDLSLLVRADWMPWVDEAVLSELMRQVTQDLANPDTILSAVEARRTTGWFDHFANFYEGLDAYAQMRRFVNRYIEGGRMHYGTAPDMWTSYQKELYVMDASYRRFHLAYTESLKNTDIHDTELGDLFKGVEEKAENLYRRFLRELNGSWESLIADDMRAHGKVDSKANIDSQEMFYEREVQPKFLKNERVFVIISDALRYETAVELKKSLLAKTNGKAELCAQMSVFPSVTKYGMAALLPHQKLTLTENLGVCCDGLSTASTADREKILQKQKDCAGSVAITYENLLSMKSDDQKALTQGAKVLYIYHNRVDAAGEERQTESKVFDACEEAIEELTALVKLLINHMNATYVVITSDHGFLYTAKPLDETEKLSTGDFSDGILESHRRAAVLKPREPLEGMLNVSMEPFGSDLLGVTPMECVRFKTGGGERYVHGGLSLQECCVPVIRFTNLRAGTYGFANVQKVKIILLSKTRRIANSRQKLDFAQTEAVGGKMVAASYKIYLTDEAGEIVSDEQTIIADKTDVEECDRTFSIRISTKCRSFTPKAKYWLNIADKDTGEIIDKTQFEILVRFQNDFGI